MFTRLLIFSIAVSLSFSSASAQHSDVRFSYEDEQVILREGISGNTDGLQIFEGVFPTSGLSIRFTEDPGFMAELVNGDMILPGDEIDIEILPSSTFASYLTFFSNTTNTFIPTDATVSIEDNSGATFDIEIGNVAVDGDNPQRIQTADNGGEIHSHIDFTLSENAEFGAYGVLFRLLPANNPMIEPSQPVWLVFNYGMSTLDFDDLAIPAFAGPDFVLGDINGDGQVNLLDVGPFVELLANGDFLPAADINQDGVINLLDVGPFIELLSGG